MADDSSAVRCRRICKMCKIMAGGNALCSRYTAMAKVQCPHTLQCIASLLKKESEPVYK